MQEQGLGLQWLQRAASSKRHHASIACRDACACTLTRRNGRYRTIHNDGNEATRVTLRDHSAHSVKIRNVSLLAGRHLRTPARYRAWPIFWRADLICTSPTEPGRAHAE